MTDRDPVAAGGCLCGAVRYAARGPLRDVVNCHCGMCRRAHGAFGAYTQACKSDVAIDGGEALGWYASSDAARRGFCRVCGSTLFWDAPDADTIAIAAGSLDMPTGLKTVGHIFVADRADFYEIADALPRCPGDGDPAGRDA